MKLTLSVAWCINRRKDAHVIVEWITHFFLPSPLPHGHLVINKEKVPSWLVWAAAAHIFSPQIFYHRDKSVFPLTFSGTWEVARA